MAKIRVTVRAILVRPDGRVLVLRREPNDENNPGRVDFPGGGIEPNESYVAAVAREIHEEAGLQVPERDLLLAYAFTSEAKEPNLIAIRLLFVAHVTDTDVRLSHEHDAYWWRTADELREAFAETSWNAAVNFALDHNLTA